MTKLKAVWLIAIPLAIAACTAEWALLSAPSPWDSACKDVADRFEIHTCEYDSPDVVFGSRLLQAITGAYGVFVEEEWRIYISPLDYLAMDGLTEDVVEYHESVHAVLSKDNPKDRCSSERIAREMTDAKFGTESANNGWEITYRCVAPSQMV